MMEKKLHDNEQFERHKKVPRNKRRERKKIKEDEQQQHNKKIIRTKEVSE